MASFCSNCGSPAAGKFCVKCGSPVQAAGGASPSVQPPAPAQPYMQTAPPGAAAASGGSAVKIIVIVAVGLFVVGAISVGSLAYFAYRAKQKITEIAKDYGVDGGSGPSFKIPSTPPAGGDCPTLPWQDASRSLGVAFERVEITHDNEQDGCEFFVSAEERQRLAKAQIAAGLSQTSKAQTDADGVKGAADVAAGAINFISQSGILERAIGSGFKDKKSPDSSKDPFLTLQLDRAGGQAAWAKIESVQSGMKSVGGSAALVIQPLEGVGDKAYLMPGGVNVMALKGNAMFSITFSFAPGGEKAAAVARQVAAHL